jgi:hypothetical protein
VVVDPGPEPQYANYEQNDHTVKSSPQNAWHGKHSHHLQCMRALGTALRLRSAARFWLATAAIERVGIVGEVQKATEPPAGG